MTKNTENWKIGEIREIDGIKLQRIKAAHLECFAKDDETITCYFCEFDDTRHIRCSKVDCNGSIYIEVKE